MLIYVRTVQNLLYADDLSIFTVIDDASGCLTLQSALSKTVSLNVANCTVIPFPGSCLFCNLVTFEEKLSFILNMYVNIFILC